MVKQFCGMIGQNGELVHDGEFVELNSPHNEVGIKIKVRGWYITKFPHKTLI